MKVINSSIALTQLIFGNNSYVLAKCPEIVKI